MDTSNTAANNDILAANAAAACAAYCDTLTVEHGFPQVINPGEFQYELDGTECVFEVHASDRIPDAFGGGLHRCATVGGGEDGFPDQISIGGECEAPIECIEGTICGGWNPAMGTYANAGTILIDKAFLEGLEIATMFACDEKAYIYSEDGTNSAFIDEPDADDFIHQIGLQEGDENFEIRRTRVDGGWNTTSWYFMNNLSEMYAAFENVTIPPTASNAEFQLKFDRGAYRLSRAIKIRDCASGGLQKGCDIGDL